MQQKKIFFLTMVLTLSVFFMVVSCGKPSTKIANIPPKPKVVYISSVDAKEINADSALYGFLKIDSIFCHNRLVDINKSRVAKTSLDIKDISDSIVKNKKPNRIDSYYLVNNMVIQVISEQEHDSAIVFRTLIDGQEIRRELLKSDFAIKITDVSNEPFKAYSIKLMNQSYLLLFFRSQMRGSGVFMQGYPFSTHSIFADITNKKNIKNINLPILLNRATHFVFDDFNNDGTLDYVNEEGDMYFQVAPEENTINLFTLEKDSFVMVKDYYVTLDICFLDQRLVKWIPSKTNWFGPNAGLFELKFPK